jgi:hypothetical protein
MYVVEFTDFTVGLNDGCLVGTTALGVEVVGKAAMEPRWSVFWKETSSKALEHSTAEAGE